MTDIQTTLEKLAVMEMPCPGDNDDHGIEECKGPVARFPWARVECKNTWMHEHPHVGDGCVDYLQKSCAYHRETCPGWGVATLDEVRLEDVLMACGKAINDEPYSMGWDGPGYDSEYWDFEGYPLADYTTPESSPEDAHRIDGQGDTPKEAALNALLQAAEAQDAT